MRLIMIGSILLVLLSACVPVTAPLVNPTITPVQIPTLAPTVAATVLMVTETPTQLTYTQCAWIWATEDLPEVSALLSKAYQDAGMTEVQAYASAFGENCMDQNGKVDHFAAMQTDFRFVLPVDDTKDTQALGDWIAKLLPPIETIPADQLSGPNPGQIFIRFTGTADEVNLNFSRKKGQELLQQGLSGSELFEALRNNP